MPVLSHVDDHWKNFLLGSFSLLKECSPQRIWQLSVAHLGADHLSAFFVTSEYIEYLAMIIAAIPFITI